MASLADKLMAVSLRARAIRYVGVDAEYVTHLETRAYTLEQGRRRVLGNIYEGMH